MSTVASTSSTSYLVLDVGEGVGAGCGSRFTLGLTAQFRDVLQLGQRLKDESTKLLQRMQA